MNTILDQSADYSEEEVEKAKAKGSSAKIAFDHEHSEALIT